MYIYRTVFLSLLFIGCASKDDGSGSDSGDNLNCSEENGTLLFQACAGCHGNDGDSRPSGSDDLNSAVKTLSDSDLMNILENGTGSMPAPNLTPCEEEAVLLYLRDTFGDFGG